MGVPSWPCPLMAHSSGTGQGSRRGPRGPGSDPAFSPRAPAAPPPSLPWSLGPPEGAQASVEQVSVPGTVSQGGSSAMPSGAPPCGEPRGLCCGRPHASWTRGYQKL